MRDANDVFDASYYVDENGCWIWERDKDSNGYGRFMVNGIRRRAHRFSYERYHGALEGLDCCHRCDTPACVNPDHLFAGTAKDNIHDAMRKGRFHKACGERNAHSKLTEEQVREIAASVGSGKSVGSRYGISDVMVYNIRNRKSWRHLWVAA